ncbi:MAG: hypothetical protein A2X86_16055 [Bdellovibrionales bacterium GWA2_49_15]|nr:MAG: hypothetical protein A2X86_16055 [Bdellovibrionales bacterium GWA2_49_15]HAZ13198.1 hypothetical protein [Bdellovibrionales bacterium]
MNNEIQEKLEKLAIMKSIPFCVGCYREAPTGFCPSCGSDDLAKFVRGEGMGWGTDWIIRSIVESELTPVNVDAAFENLIRSCYEENVSVLWMTLDAVTVAKEMDPVSWDIAKSEWLSQEEEEGIVKTFDNGASYFWCHELEKLLDAE